MTPGLGPTADAPRYGRTDPAAWQSWWRYNRDCYLDLKRILAAMEVRTVGDGTRPAGPALGERSTPVSEAIALRDVIPALQQAMKDGGKYEFIRAALIALARTEATFGDQAGTSTNFLAKHWIGQPAPESAEAAVIALGIRGDKQHAPMLMDLLRDNEAGRKLRGTDKVDYRIRSLAAYSLGLIGERNEDPALRVQIAMAFIENLEANANAPFDTQLASLIAMGMVPMAPCDEEGGKASGKSPKEHFCRGRQVGMLLDYMADSRRHTRLRAQAAIPLARLTVGSSEEHQRIVAESLLGALDPRAKANPEIKQACVIALGILGDSDDDDLDQAIADALIKEVTRGDRLSRPFALIALAKLAGDPGQGQNSGKTLAKAQALLLKQLVGGKSGLDAWSSVALGVLGRELALNKKVTDPEVLEGLRQNLTAAKTPDEVAATSVALGLLRDGASNAVMLEKLGRVGQPASRASIALAIGLGGARDARTSIAERFASANPSSDEFRHLAIGLRLLGDRSVVARVAQAARESDDPAVRAGLVSTLGVLGDVAAVAPLVATVTDKSLDDTVRAAAAAALGELSDGRSRPWNASISQDLHYDLLSSTLISYSGDGSGLLEMR